MGGGGGSSTVVTRNVTEVRPVTNIDVDTKPLGEILAESNEKIAKTRMMLQAQQIKAQQKQLKAQQKQLKAQQKQQQIEVVKMKIMDTYIEHAKNGLILSGIAIAVLYASSKKRKRR